MKEHILKIYFFFTFTIFSYNQGEKTDRTTNKLHRGYQIYVTLHYAQHGFASTFASSSQPFLHEHVGWCWKGETA